MTKLTSRERLLRTIRHEEVDRIAVSPRYFDWLYGTQGCECVLHCLWMKEQYAHDLMIPYGPPLHNYLLNYAGPYNDLEGVEAEIQTQRAGEALKVRRRFKTPAGELTAARSVSLPGSVSVFPHISEPLVKDREDLEAIGYLLQPPDQVVIADIPLLRRLVGDDGLLTVYAAHGPDQFLMDAVGVEAALLSYYDDPELLVELLRLFHDYRRMILKRILAQGVDVIFEGWYNCSMSVGWSPDQYREIFLPLIEENVDLVHSYGALVNHYNDGKMDPVLEDLANAGCDIIETLSPPPLGDVDLASAKERVGLKTCLKGHIDQVNLICYGKREQIREAVRRAIEIASPGGGFILGTADSIRPESPIENIKAYFDAALEFGTFK